jgi:hypothetical protein
MEIYKLVSLQISSVATGVVLYLILRPELLASLAFMMMDL